METQDPVMVALEKLTKSIPDSIQPLITAYRKHGVESLDDAWKQVIKDAISENN